MMASDNSKKSILRMLWIPGTRKTHPKGRYTTTNKQISYSTRPKKSEVWSLGGSKLQKDLLQADSDTALLDGPSSSGLVSVACAATAGAIVAAEAISAAPSTIRCNGENFENVTPTSPNSTASTAPLVTPPLNPLDEALNNTFDSESNKMPANNHYPIPVIVTATTTAEIMNANRFSLLNNGLKNNELDVYSMASPPKTFLNSNGNVNGTCMDTLAQVSSSDSHNTTENGQNLSIKSTPEKNTLPRIHNNNNNNQGDVNSIESVNDDIMNKKLNSFGQEQLLPNHVLSTKYKKKRKKKHANVKELDQLDGIPPKHNANEQFQDDDETVVKCLYYTLMCCDCTIS